MKLSSLTTTAAAALALAALTACDGLKEAMTAHVDTAARVGSEELSVERLSKLLDTIQIPPRKDVAMELANTWISYQLLANAAASGDTVVDDKTLDKVLWSTIANIKAKKYYDLVSKNWTTADPALAQKLYDNGEILAASHILVLTKGKPESEKAAAKQKAEALRAQVTAANFAAIATKSSDDKESAVQGGSLGLFGRGMMVPQFETALLAIKPGEISPVIETEFGYHIIRRPTYAEVQSSVQQAAQRRGAQVAESTFVANLQAQGHLEIKSNIGATTRAVLADPQGHLEDNSTLATSDAGKFTARRLAEWIQAMPPQVVMQQRAQLQSAPDSIMTLFVKNFVTNDLVIRAADSLKLAPSAEEMATLRKSFSDVRGQAWQTIGIDPKTIADSVKAGDKSARETFAARKAEEYFAKVVSGSVPFLNVPVAVTNLLRENVKASVNSAGVDRAVEIASKSRSKADSVRRAKAPASAVPMPGGSSSPEVLDLPSAPAPSTGTSAH